MSLFIAVSSNNLPPPCGLKACCWACCPRAGLSLWARGGRLPGWFGLDEGSCAQWRVWLWFRVSMFTLAVCVFPGILGEMEVRKVPVSVFWGLCVCVWQREAFLKQRGPSSPTLSEQAKANKQSYPLILLARHVVSNLNGLSSYTPPKTGSDTLKMLLLARLIWPGNIQVR